MSTLSKRLVLSSLALLMASCGDSNTEGNDDDNTPPTGTVPQQPAVVPAALVDCGKGSASLNGRFLAPNGTTPVAGGFVYLSSGNCWVGTDKDGAFTAKGLPSGSTEVHVQKGLFKGAVKASPGTAVSVKADGAKVKLAYVLGGFDRIQDVLERLGVQAEALSADELANVKLSDYSALFLNCGMDDTYAEDPDTRAALKAYVENGGVLYASDWAESYVQHAFPDKVTFLKPDTRVGEEGLRDASVLDEGLTRALGRKSASINFDQGGWAVIDSVPATTQVLVRGPASDYNGNALSERPYVVQFSQGNGRVTYTSFHTEAQATDDMHTLLEQLLFNL
ncbi:hypothetical protein P2318_28285 [Myxococcaceae bacterium GXIMD 01537]